MPLYRPPDAYEISASDPLAGEIRAEPPRGVSDLIFELIFGRPVEALRASPTRGLDLMTSLTDLLQPDPGDLARMGLLAGVRGARVSSAGRAAARAARAARKPPPQKGYEAPPIKVPPELAKEWEAKIAVPNLAEDMLSQTHKQRVIGRTRRRAGPETVPESVQEGGEEVVESGVDWLPDLEEPVIGWHRPSQLSRFVRESHPHAPGEPLGEHRSRTLTSGARTIPPSQHAATSSYPWLSGPALTTGQDLQRALRRLYGVEPPSRFGKPGQYLMPAGKRAPKAGPVYRVRPLDEPRGMLPDPAPPYTPEVSRTQIKRGKMTPAEAMKENQRRRWAKKGGPTQP